MKLYYTVIVIFLSLMPHSFVHANPIKILMGQEATNAYAQKPTYRIKQIDKKFVLVRPDGSEDKDAKTLSIGVGDSLFISNDEEKITHNIYDISNRKFIIKKQKPGEDAMVTFNEARKVKLRCAIHPKMKFDLTVE